MTHQHVSRKNQQSKSDTPLASGILQRAAVQTVPEKNVQPIEEEATTFKESRFHHNFCQVPVSTGEMPIIQPKLKIGAVGDRYEQEADRVAQDVVQRINAPAPEMGDEDEVMRKTQEGSLQREEIPEEEDELRMKPIVQRLSAEGGMAAPPDLESSIQRARGGGQPLADSVREPMERAFGANFSGVRVHADATSDQMNQSIQAKAFTTGQDVFFRSGAYDPGSRGGQELLAHELTHVVQQNGLSVGQEHQVPLCENMRPESASSTLVQRDIQGQHEYEEGWLKINFQQHVTETGAGEEGDITFVPKVFGRPLDKIYLEQSVKATRYQGLKEITTPLDPRLRDMEVVTGIGLGYYADNVPQSLGLKEKWKPKEFKQQKEDQTLHYYVNAGMESEREPTDENVEGENTVGTRKKGGRGGNIVKPARLHDTPSFTEPISYEFLTSATEKTATKTPERLGHVSWGFDIVAKNASQLKVEKEHVKFIELNGGKAQEANEKQNATRTQFYEALDKNNWRQPSEEYEHLDEEANYERKVYAIMRMTDFKEKYPDLTIDQLRTLMQDKKLESTWKNMYEILVQSDVFPSGRRF